NYAINQVAPWYCTDINQAIVREWTSWLPVGMAVIIVSFSIAAMIFIVGLALRNERVRNFGIGEFYEAAATGIIIVFFLFIAAVMLGLVPALFIGTTNPYVTALNYVSSVSQGTQQVIYSLFGVVNLVDFYSSINVSVKVANSGSASDLANFIAGCLNSKGSNTGTRGAVAALCKGGGLFVGSVQEPLALSLEILFAAPANVLLLTLMDGLVVLNIEFYLIIFAMYSAIPVFLLPGAILRAFMPTRSLGGMMMSIGIAFFFVMPILFSVAFYFTHQSAVTALNTAASRLAQYGSGSGAETNALTPTSPLVTTLSNLQNGMGGYWLSILFYPALIMGMTYFSVITMADFIGGFAHSTGKIIGQM
ncbi:MAG: hypothetical protein KGH61_02180, partial [Candidatus Micrarchaeota archaeon]|nr:hypothetical protein [Candidatus Micrarchaeota archaeon]